MKEVKVQKDALLERVKANRERHETVFKDAVKGWRTEVAKVIGTLYGMTQGQAEPGDIQLEIQGLYRLNRPEEHLDEYDQVITMLEMSIDDEITLSWQEFQQYVMDNWQWKEAWKISNSRYTSVERA